jgi:hypothetical protein
MCFLFSVRPYTGAAPAALEAKPTTRAESRIPRSEMLLGALLRPYEF